MTRLKFIKFFIIIYFLIIIFSLNIFAQQNTTWINMTLGIISDNQSFEELYISNDDDVFFEFIPLSFSIFFDKNYYFYSFEFENYLTESVGFSKNYMLFFETGFGLFLPIGPFVIRAILNAGFGCYFLKIVHVFDSQNEPLIGKMMSDMFIYAEPELMVGLKLNKKFILYFGINKKYALFFNVQISGFSPLTYYLKFSYLF